MTEKRKGTPRNTRLYILLAGLIIVMAAVMIALNVREPVPQAFLDVTRTQEALHQTATYYGQFPRPEPSMTYHGDCYMGSATACAGDRMREFDTDYQRFQLYGSIWAAETLTAVIPSMTAP